MIEMEARTMNYGGELSPTSAWELLANNPEAVLVDVRTLPEWTFVGCPDLSKIGKRLIKLSWRLYPTMEINPKFQSQIQQEVSNKEAPLIFICRTGGRSLDAAIAMTDAGYKFCYNLTDGFEGSINKEHRRGSTSGWKAENLPWEQS